MVLSVVAGELDARTGALPMSRGLPATVLISMSAEQYARGTGYALTSFGQRVGVAEALRLAGEGLIGWVVHIVTWREGGVTTATQPTPKPSLHRRSAGPHERQTGRSARGRGSGGRRRRCARTRGRGCSSGCC
jgi:hypothetical protein